MTMNQGKVDAKLKKLSEEVRKLAMAFPETQEDHPWEHSAFKVKKKTFVFMALDADGLRLSFKLDQSLFNTLALPMCEPTHYGLGKSGWVTASFEAGDNVPMSHVEKWINESFRLIAPKTIVKHLDARGNGKRKPESGSKESAKTIAVGSKKTASGTRPATKNSSANRLTAKSSTTKKQSGRVKTSMTKTQSKKPVVTTSTTKPKAKSRA